MTEPILILHWLHSILTTDTVLTDPATGVLGGFTMVPVAGVTDIRSPYGVVRMLTAAEDLTGLNNGGLIWVPTIYEVNLYDRVRADFTRLDPLASRVYTILHAKSGSPTGGVVFGCHRLNIKAGEEAVGDAVARYINQQFSIEAKSD